VLCHITHTAGFQHVKSAYSNNHGNWLCWNNARMVLACFVLNPFSHSLIHSSNMLCVIPATCSACITYYIATLGDFRYYIITESKKTSCVVLVLARNLGFHLTPAVVQSCSEWLRNHCLNEKISKCICCRLIVPIHLLLVVSYGIINDDNPQDFENTECKLLTSAIGDWSGGVGVIIVKMALRTRVNRHVHHAQPC
jgi:hypothetical protein